MELLAVAGAYKLGVALKVVVEGGGASFLGSYDEEVGEDAQGAVARR